MCVSLLHSAFYLQLNKPYGYRIMNVTNEISRLVQHCYLLNSKYEFFIEYPSQASFVSQCGACAGITILIFPTVILNGLSVVVILKCPQLKEKISYFLIMMQSVSDLIVGLLTLPSLSYICISEVIGPVTCVPHVLLLRTMFAPYFFSIWILTIMTVERYIGVLHPLRHRTLVTKKRITIFVLCGVVSMPVLTAITFLHSYLFETLFSIYLFIFILVAIFIYTKIFLAIRNRNIPGNFVVNTASETHKKDKRIFFKEIKLVKSCFLVAACFFLCLFSSGIVNVMNLDRHDLIMLRPWVTIPLLFNSSLNSLIFFWCKPLLRNEAWKVFKGIRNAQT